MHFIQRERAVKRQHDTGSGRCAGKMLTQVNLNPCELKICSSQTSEAYRFTAVLPG